MGEKEPFGGLSADQLAEGAETADWLADDYAAQGFPHLADAYRVKAEQRRQAADTVRETP